MPTYQQNEKSKMISLPQQKRIMTGAMPPLELGLSVDASDSMAHLRNTVIAGFNILLDEQKPGTRVSSNIFASHVSFLHRNLAIESVPRLTEDTYVLGGATALLDGIGLIIREIGDRFDMTRGVRNRVLIAILTDGMENLSHMFSFDHVFHAIHHRRLVHHWEFLFLTAASGGTAYGLRLGIQRSNIVEFDPDPAKLKMLLERLSRAVGAYQLGDRNFTRLLLTDI